MAGMGARLSTCLFCCPLLVAGSALTWDQALRRAMLNAGLISEETTFSAPPGTPQLTSQRFRRDVEVTASIQVLQVGLKPIASRRSKAQADISGSQQGNRVRSGTAQTGSSRDSGSIYTPLF